MFRKQLVPMALSLALLCFAAVPVLAQDSSSSPAAGGNSVIPEKVDRLPDGNLPDNSLPPDSSNSLERGKSPGMDSPDLNLPEATDPPTDLTPPSDDDSDPDDGSTSL